MPNWCHDVLTVSTVGENVEELERFVEAVKPTAEMLREQYEHWPERQLAEKPATLGDYVKLAQEAQPLTFASIVPEPSEAEYAEMVEASLVTCRLCAGKGKRPVTQEEADGWGAPFYPDVGLPDLPFEERQDCNSCGGRGQEPSFGAGWYNWRCANWGTKWDASFDGPFGAMVSEEADVDASVEAQGATVTKYVAVYKFDTAWSPPIPFVEAAAERFPDLEFELKFGEPGNDFAGRTVFQGGVCQEETELEVKDVLAAEDMWY